MNRIFVFNSRNHTRLAIGVLIFLLIGYISFVNNKQTNENQLRNVKTTTKIASESKQQAKPVVPKYMADLIVYNQSFVFRHRSPVIWPIFETPREKLYYCEKNSIFVIDVKTGTESRLAGGGTKKSFEGNDVKALDASFDGPFSLTFDRRMNLFFLDDHGMNVHRLDLSTGVLSTFFTHKAYGDESMHVQKVSVNPFTSEVILIYRTHLRTVDKVTHDFNLLAGSEHKIGSTGDGGLATNATFGSIGTFPSDLHM
jgi:hypothetical protein